MRALAHKRTGMALGLLLAVGGLAVTGSTASAAAVTINLCATAGMATISGAVTVPVWGFASNPGSCTGVAPQLPGAVLSVNEGDVVTINVTNGLPAGHTLTFEIPGINFNAGPTDAAVGGTVTRTFTASAPGTYIYESGGDFGRQEAMGLYGAFIVRPLTANLAYDAATTAYDAERTLVLSAIDPNFNAAPDTFDMKQFKATYWLINGQGYPDTPAIPAPGGNRRLLLRYVNAGYDNTTMALLGLHERVIARDARLLLNPFDANAETIPAGATEDAIAVIPSSGAPSSHGFPLYNRQLHLTNGSAPPGGGGMMTFIQP